MLVGRRQEIWHNGVMAASCALLGVASALVYRFLDDFSLFSAGAIVLGALGILFAHRWLRALRSRDSLLESVVGDSLGTRRVGHVVIALCLLAMAAVLLRTAGLAGTARAPFALLGAICLVAAGMAAYVFVRVLREPRRSHPGPGDVGTKDR